MPYEQEQAQAKQARDDYEGKPRRSKSSRDYELDESAPVTKGFADLFRSKPGVASYIRHYSKLVEDDAKKQGRQPDDEDFMNALYLAQARYETDKKKRKQEMP